MNFLIILFILILLVVVFVRAGNYLFYGAFRRRAREISQAAGWTDRGEIVGSDLDGLPEPVARYLTHSGLIGKTRISSVRLIHRGTFRAGANRPFMPIRGEYFLTSARPSFCWYGKMSILPGITVSATDEYFAGRGRMHIRALSLIRIADSRDANTIRSAFGRCMAEMTMIPSFFLDRNRIRWLPSDENSAAFEVTDQDLTTRGTLFVHPDGALDRIVVERYYDRGKNTATPEKFTGKASGSKEFDGLILPAVFDGYWNLPEGDLHYVHFTVDRVEYC